VVKGRIDITEGAIIALVVSACIAIFFKGPGPQTNILAMLSVATFLFGIFGAFVMQNRHKRLQEIRTVLRRDDALYIDMYKLSSLFGKETQKKMQKHIDDFLTRGIDYRLVDYCMANKEFLKLHDFIINLKPKTALQSTAYGKLLDLAKQANEQRREVEYLVRNSMLSFKWITLMGLLAVILFSIFYTNDGSLPSIIITVLLSTASILFLLLIRDLDSLMWKEQMWIWEPLNQLFEELDLLPYYAEPIIAKGRVKFKKGYKIRVAYYPHPYPDMRGKTVKTVIIK
jgi:hypothetical protein